MQVLADQIMERASTLPEGAPIAAKSLLHLGSRAAVDQALSRLMKNPTTTFRFIPDKHPHYMSTASAPLCMVCDLANTACH